MTNLTIGRETFRVVVDGDATKPALMLSNALGTDLSMWDGQVAPLARHFRVIRYDPRGHGRSDAGTAPVSIASLGRDALAILDALEVDRANWLGLSMGGAVGLWLLVHAPDRIERAVLANTAARLGTPDGWNARIASILAGGIEENAAATIERWFSPAYVSSDRGRVDAVHAMLRGASPEGYAACCAALRDTDLRAALGSIANEVLVVAGRDDPVVPAADADALISGIAGARHVALDAKHMSNMEAQADFNAAVIAFLTRAPRKAKEASPRAGSSRKSPAAKPAPVKRGGASRRSNPARNPLKAAPKKVAARKTKTSRAATTTSRPRSAAKRAAKRAAPKATAKPRASKAPVKKAALARRPTPTAAARGAVKKAAPSKRATAKAASKKVAVKGTTKRPPAPRRKPVKKPRRSTGRRKS